MITAPVCAILHKFIIIDFLILIIDLRGLFMKLSQLALRAASAWTMFIFGILALILGLLSLIQPEITLQLLNLPVLDRANRLEGDFTVVFLTASSMASFNMGVYYVL